MTRTLTKEEIFELPVEARLHLIETIWDSMSPMDVAVPESHKRALDAALEDFRHDPDSGDSWDEVRSDFTRQR
jgi:putative addiction module component (TIGR02574 family)